jgi:hypothetical protein
MAASRGVVKRATLDCPRGKLLRGSLYAQIARKAGFKSRGGARLRTASAADLFRGRMILEVRILPAKRPK